jgi:UDP-glucose 4-epimerase
VADPKKAGAMLGWAPQYSDLSAIISDAWRWHNHGFLQQGREKSVRAKFAQLIAYL